MAVAVAAGVVVWERRLVEGVEEARMPAALVARLSVGRADTDSLNDSNLAVGSRGRGRGGGKGGGGGGGYLNNVEGYQFKCKRKTVSSEDGEESVFEKTWLVSVAGVVAAARRRRRVRRLRKVKITSQL